MKEYINCTNCRSSAVTVNGKICNSIKSGKVCGGRIIKVKGVLVKAQNQSKLPRPDSIVNVKYLGFWRLK